MFAQPLRNRHDYGESGTINDSLENMQKEEKIAFELVKLANAVLDESEKPKIKPIYSAVFLIHNSKSKLLSHFPAKHQNVFAEHCTLKFGLSEEDIKNLSVGQEVKILVNGYAEDEKGQAVSVELKGIKSNNIIPHITISTAIGVKPFYSNELLKKDLQKVSHLELDGIVDFFPRTL